MDTREVLRRRVLVSLSEQDIRNMLDLPPETYVVGVHGNWNTNTIDVCLVSPVFDAVPEGVEPPAAYKTLTPVTCEDCGTRLILDLELPNG